MISHHRKEDITSREEKISEEKNGEIKVPVTDVQIFFDENDIFYTLK
jgi:hypothetical protein